MPTNEETMIALTIERAARTREIDDGLREGLAAMQQIIDAAPVTFTNLAGAQTASQQMQTAIKAEARQLRRLTRLALTLLDAAD